MDTWGGTEARPLGSIAVNRDGNGISRSEPKPRPTDGEKLRQAMKAVIAEYAIRWPCPVATDPNIYEARLEILARDLGDMAPGLARKAGDAVARIPGRPNVLPSASEIYAAAEAIIAERAAARAASEREQAMQHGQRAPVPGDKVATYHAANRLALNNGGRVIQTDDGELFRLGDPGERRGVRSDGSAIVPWFHHNKGDGDTVPNGWYCKHDDVAALSDCYRQHAARFVLRGAMIVERGE